MTLFNKDKLINIIADYFDKKFINNFIHYNESYFILLSELLNLIYDVDYYNNQSQQFFYNNIYINYDCLFIKYPELIEFQPILLLIYEILVQTTSLDFYNLKIDDYILLNELENNNNFFFLNSVVNEYFIEFNINKFNKELDNIKL